MLVNSRTGDPSLRPLYPVTRTCSNTNHSEFKKIMSDYIEEITGMNNPKPHMIQIYKNMFGERNPIPAVF